MLTALWVGLPCNGLKESIARNRRHDHLPCDLQCGEKYRLAWERMFFQEPAMQTRPLFDQQVIPKRGTYRLFQKPDKTSQDTAHQLLQLGILSTAAGLPFCGAPSLLLRTHTKASTSLSTNLRHYWRENNLRAKAQAPRPCVLQTLTSIGRRGSSTNRSQLVANLAHVRRINPTRAFSFSGVMSVDDCEWFPYQAQLSVFG